MFNGIVETKGLITRVDNHSGCRHFIITPDRHDTDIILGESIAVNGVCLTVTDITSQNFNVTAVPETLQVTNLGRLQTGDFVNLERALKIGSRQSGHFVQGHIDGMGQILELTHDNSSALLVKIELCPSLTKYVVRKGYIAIDGISITVIEKTSTWFTATFIPYTQKATIIKYYRENTLVNIEVDMMGKYIENLLRENPDAICHATR